MCVIRAGRLSSRKERYVMVACFCLRIASFVSTFNVDLLYDPATVRQWKKRERKGMYYYAVEGSWNCCKWQWYRIMKELAGGRKFFDMWGTLMVDSSFTIMRNRKGGRNRSTVLKYLTSDKILLLGDEMASYCNMQMWPIPSNRSENISATNALNWSKIAEFDCLPAELPFPLI